MATAESADTAELMYLCKVMCKVMWYETEARQFRGGPSLAARCIGAGLTQAEELLRRRGPDFRLWTKRVEGVA